MKIVIRAGGTGTRLWPMSRKNNPKQFQSVVGDKSMIKNTYERVAPLFKNPDDLFISVNYAFREKIKEEIPEINKRNIILETDTRNTGPAMCLEVCYLEKFCDHKDVIASLPSDDYISDSAAFRNLLSATEKFIISNPDYILTPAIRPTYIDTGYTYFRAGDILQGNGQETIYSVADVVEKPDLDYCAKLIEKGIYFCHTGMYLWQLGHIVNLLKKFQPKMYKICVQIVDLMDDDKNIEKIRELYVQLEKISIESAITDKVDKLAMSVSNHIGWSDLGKWHVIKRILSDKEGDNLVKGNVETRSAENNLIYSNVDKKIIVVNDINNLVIVDTEDALFISSLEKSAEVKNVVEKLKEEGQDKYL